MPNRLEWENVQERYKDALKDFLASKEKPAAADDEGAKDIPVITIDDNDAAMECSAENVDDDKNSVKKAEPLSEEVVAADDGGEGEKDGTADAAAVVVNPDLSITDKALTDYQKQKFISLIYPTLSVSLPPFIIRSFIAWIIVLLLS